MLKDNARFLRYFVFLLIGVVICTFMYTYYMSLHKKLNIPSLVQQINQITSGNVLPVENSIKPAFTYDSLCACKRDLIKIENSTSSFKVYVNDKLSYDIDESKFKNLQFTCNPYDNFRRGPNQKVIGYSLYGKNELYYKLLKAVAKQIKKLYPGWIMRVHYDDSIDKSVICELECLKENDVFLNNVDFCNVNNLTLNVFKNTKINADYMHKMKWRWFPIGDSFVDIFCSRDSDSNVYQREVDSVNVWINSNMVGHIMRDNPQHGTAILGGMWGYHSKLNRDESNVIFSKIMNTDISRRFNPNKQSPKGLDQSFLAEIVYPMIRAKSVIHDSYLCQSYGGSPFPTQRKGNCFVGRVGDCDENDKFLECPVACRPKDHQDWTYC